MIGCFFGWNSGPQFVMRHLVRLACKIAKTAKRHSGRVFLSQNFSRDDIPKKRSWGVYLDRMIPACWALQGQDKCAFVNQIQSQESWGCEPRARLEDFACLARPWFSLGHVLFDCGQNKNRLELHFGESGVSASRCLEGVRRSDDGLGLPHVTSLITSDTVQQLGFAWVSRE